MLSTARRRMSPIAGFWAFLLLFTSTASAAVLGIDFGTLNIKAALVKPGIPLDIVLTKDSKRKETAAVAFKPNRDEKNNIVAQAGTFPERAYGSDALALQGRLPGEVFPNLKLLLGLSADVEGRETVAIYKERYPALQVDQLEGLGTTVFKSSAFPNDDLPWSVEELVGMELANIKRNALVMAGQGSVVEDAVITIPSFYTAEERQAIVKAANFAGLKVIALISDGLAVGLDYAKTRTFPEVSKGEHPEYHLVYDMGAGSTTATVLRFQGRSVKDIGRFNKTVQEVAVMGVGWERRLGGDALNHVLMEDFVRKLLTKPVLKSRGTAIDEIKKNGRIMSRFFKEAERVRQILSANSEASASFEEILPDIDLRVKITRTEFEKLTETFAERVESPITEALKMAKLDIKDINSLILHGGAVRTPFVQSKLEGAVDDRAKIRSSVNPDESAVFGAAFKAASLSASFKVKEIRASDIVTYATSLTYVDKGRERKQPLFAPTSPVGAGATTKQVTFKDKDDFDFAFVQNVNGADRSILRINSENLTASVQELSRKTGCDKESISTKFSIRLGAQQGLPEAASGSVSCEVDDTKSGSVGDSVKGWLGFGKKKDQEPLGGEEDDGPIEQVDAAQPADTTSSSSSTSAASSSTKAADMPKKTTEIIPLKWSSAMEGNFQSDKQSLSAATQRLASFDQSDKARYARDEAQNVLESYTYFVRDFLENKDYESASTKDERDLISKTLQSTRDWMESVENSKATTATLKEKYNALKKLIDPIQKRRTEDRKRPEMVKSLQKTLDELQKAILRIESEASKAASSIAKAATASESSTTASRSVDSDDLEVPDISESASTSTETALTNPYASIDLTTVKETYSSISEWLKETMADQQKLKTYEDPVLLTKDMETKASEIASSLQDLLNKASLASQASTKKPKSTKSKASKKAKATADAAADADGPVPVDEPNTDVPPVVSEGADPEAVANSLKDKEPAAEETAGKKGGQKPVTGDESLEDMIKLMKDGKVKMPKPDIEHEEL